MAAPTRAQIESTTNDLLRILEQTRNYFGGNDKTNVGSTGNFFAGNGVTGTDSLEKQSRDGLTSTFEFHAGINSQVELFRASFDGVLRRAPAMLEPAILEYGKFINAPERDVITILRRRLYDDFIANAQRVQSRNFTYGTPTFNTAASGTGLINRIVYDDQGIAIENMFPETKTARCIADEHSGASKHEEVFEFRGQDASKDTVIIDGSGKRKKIRCRSARDSLNFIQNPSFTDGTAGSDITGWTVDTGAVGMSTKETTIVYRDYEGDSTSTSLKVTTTTASRS